MSDNPFCYGVDDIDNFLAKCKVTLYPQKWNIWRLALNADRYETPEDIQNAVERLLSFLLGSGLDLPTVVENFYSPVDNVQYSFEPPPNLGKKIADRLFDCYQPMWLAGSKYHDIYIRFVYRGTVEKEISWPAYKEWNLAYAQCPTDADMFLDKVYEPLREKIPRPPEEEITDVFNPTKSVTGVLLWGGAAFGAFFLAKSLLK